MCAMTKNAQIATRILSEFNLKYGVRQVRNDTLVEMSFSVEELPEPLNCAIVFDADDDAVSVRVLDYISYPTKAVASIQALCNDCNYRFQFVKFVTDPNTETVDVHMESFVNSADVANVVHTSLGILIELLRKLYPLFLVAQNPNMQIVSKPDELDDVVKRIIADRQAADAEESVGAADASEPDEEPDTDAPDETSGTPIPPV